MIGDKWQKTYITEMSEDYVGQSMTGDREDPAGIQALVNATGMSEEEVIDMIQNLGFDPSKLTKPEFEEVLKHVDGMNEEEVEIPDAPADEEIPEVDIDSEKIPEPVAEEEEEESPIDKIDRSLYFVLSLVTQALDGDDKALTALSTIDTLIDGKVGNQAVASRKIGDKFNDKDDANPGNAPRLKTLFKDVYFKLSKASKEAESQEQEGGEQEEV
jgi:hypothetical protein